MIARLRAAWRNACAANADIDDCQPIWPWVLCGLSSLTIIGLLFAGALYFAGLAHSAKTGKPTVESHRP